MRLSMSKQLESQELSECPFKPNVIGFNYDNSGLTTKHKEYYKKAKPAANSKPVHQRCQEWLEKKEDKLVSKEAEVKMK